MHVIYLDPKKITSFIANVTNAHDKLCKHAAWAISCWKGQRPRVKGPHVGYCPQATMLWPVICSLTSRRPPLGRSPIGTLLRQTMLVVVVIAAVALLQKVYEFLRRLCGEFYTTRSVSSLSCVSPARRSSAHCVLQFSLSVFLLLRL